MTGPGWNSARRAEEPLPLIGRSDAMRRVRLWVEQIGDSQEPVLITGETGAGKEVVARAIHAASRRRERPFVAVNVCALPLGVLESELFGHERGAFTGAHARRVGRFEQAAGATLLLDEVGDAPPELQAKLLRVVETRTFERVGGNALQHTDVRILAATHRDLPADVARGRFREDLWYRLSALHVEIPALRTRPDDVVPLTRLELARLSAEHGGQPFSLEEEALHRLIAHPWPGNVRELMLTLRRMALLAGPRRTLTRADVERALLQRTPASVRFAGEVAVARAVAGVAAPGPRSRLGSAERETILSALESHGWNVSAAARGLGVSRGALRYRISRLGLEPWRGAAPRG